MKTKLLYIVILSLVIVSCTKTVEYPAGENNKKPVVFSFINQNEVSVQLYWSRLLTEGSNLTNIDNATILLYEDDILIGELNFVSLGKYQISNFGAKEGREYKIIIDVPDYGEVIATTKMPYRVNTEFSLTQTEENSYIALNQMFTDPLNEDNFYYTSVNAHLFYGDTMIDTVLNYSFSSVMYTNFYNNNGSVFHDRMINGEVYNCLIKIEDNFFSYYDSDNHTHVYCDSAIIIPTLRMINFDMYQYSVDVGIQNYNNDNAFAEPYPIHSNIINGYGIFAAYIGYSDSLKYVPVSSD